MKEADYHIQDANDQTLYEKYLATDLLCVLKAALARGIKEPDDVTAAHVAHFIDTVISISTKLSISYSTFAGLVTLMTENFHIARIDADTRCSFEFEPIYECIDEKYARK